MTADELLQRFARAMAQVESVRELRLVVQEKLLEFEPTSRMAFLSTLATEIFLDVAKECGKTTDELLALWAMRMRLNFERHQRQLAGAGPESLS